MSRFRWEVVASWTLLGLVAITAFPDVAASWWVWLVGTPWLVGLALVATLPPSMIDSAARQLTERSSGRLALVALGALLALAALLVTPSAAVLVLLWMSCAFMLLLRVAGASRMAEFLVNVTMLAAVVTVCGLSAEFVLRYPPLAREWGSPQVRAEWEDRYDGIWRRNVLGFRSPYESVTPPEGTFRVLALGDSFTWGDKVTRADSTWPAVLERELEERLPGRSFQVVNAGQRGFTTANEAELLRRLGWGLNPDLVLVQYYVNDVFPSTPDFGRSGSDAVFDPVQLLPVRFRVGPAGSSALVAFLEGRINSLFDPGPGERFAPLYLDGQEGWRQMQEAMAEMGRSSAGRDVPVLFVVVPALMADESRTGEHPHRSIHDQVIDEAETAGLRTLDLTPAFSRLDREIHWWATPYDMHPSPAAHALIARRVAEALVDRGLVDSEPSDMDSPEPGGS